MFRLNGRDYQSPSEIAERSWIKVSTSSESHGHTSVYTSRGICVCVPGITSKALGFEVVLKPDIRITNAIKFPFLQSGRRKKNFFDFIAPTLMPFSGRALERNDFIFPFHIGCLSSLFEKKKGILWRRDRAGLHNAFQFLFGRQEEAYITSRTISGLSRRKFFIFISRGSDQEQQ